MMNSNIDTPGTMQHRADMVRHQWIAEAAYFKAIRTRLRIA